MNQSSIDADSLPVMVHPVFRSVTLTRVDLNDTPDLVTGDGQMDLIVETDGGIEEVLEVRDVFGMQPGGNNGKRAILFVLSDHLNTAKMLTNNRGLVVWPHHQMEENKLLPFGKDLDFDATNPDPVEASYKLTFSNKEIDHKLDLHYFGARYYSATDARFTSPDPVGGTPTDPLSWNRYLYCRNDPVNLFDPDGCRVVESRVLLGDDFIQWVRGIEDSGGTTNDPFQTLQNIVGMDTAELDWYIQADGIGTLNTIDYKHFMKTAFWSAVANSTIGGITAGHLNEWILQKPWNLSFYNPEDMPSNIIGSMFGSSLLSYFPLSDQLLFFFQLIGVNMIDKASLESHKAFLSDYYKNNPEWSSTTDSHITTNFRGGMWTGRVTMWEKQPTRDQMKNGF